MQIPTGVVKQPENENVKKYQEISEKSENSM